MADGLSAYLNGVQERLQAAERERAVAVAREAEQRKRREGAAGAGGGGGGAAAGRRGVRLVAERAGPGSAATARRAATPRPWPPCWASARRRCGPATRPRRQVALEAAQKRSAEGGAEEQAQRLGRLDADLALLRDLDAIDQFRWTWSENRFPDPAVVAARTREALSAVRGRPRRGAGGRGGGAGVRLGGAASGS